MVVRKCVEAYLTLVGSTRHPVYGPSVPCAFPSVTSESQASSMERDTALSQVYISPWSSPPVSTALAPHSGFLPYHLIPQKVLLPGTKIPGY